MEVGLATADPSNLELLTDDGLCRQLWDALSAVPPVDGFKPVFFRWGERYVIGDYADPQATQPGAGHYYATAALDSQLEILSPVLLH